jgi:sugar lactone lactonase YvrE
MAGLMRRPLVQIAVSRYTADAGESPWWDSVTATILWVDIRGHRLLRHHPDTGLMDVFDAPAWPSFAVPLQGGGILCAARDGLFVIDPHSGAARLMFRPDILQPGMRFNDGTVDPGGRLVIGTMSMNKEAMPLTGGLYAIDRNRTAHCLLEGLGIVNGLAFSADGSTLYVADSHPERRIVRQFRYDRENPRLDEGRMVADFRALGLPGAPDGAAIDTRGGYWIAAHGAGKLLRFGPDLRSWDIPCAGVSKLAFVGDRRDQVAVTGFGAPLLLLDLGFQGPALPCLSW